MAAKEKDRKLREKRKMEGKVKKRERKVRLIESREKKANDPARIEMRKRREIERQEKKENFGKEEPKSVEQKLYSAQNTSDKAFGKARKVAKLRRQLISEKESKKLKAGLFSSLIQNPKLSSK